MTSMSRTSYNQFFPAGFALTFASENREAAEKLRSAEERIKRGHDNSLVQLTLVSQRVREAAKNVPCIDELRKRSEDKAQSTWEKFLVKHHGLMKKQQQLEKAQKEEERGAYEPDQAEDTVQCLGVEGEAQGNEQEIREHRQENRAEQGAKEAVHDQAP
jgi:hypothetical protein